MDKISLCLCTYNGEKFIESQLLSIVNQTLLPTEIVVYDDGSTDNTIGIIKSISQKYTNIEWRINVNDKNYGWKTNFCKAINDAKYEYIFLADQDDIWDKEKIEKMMSIISNNNNILLLTCNYILWLENLNTFKKKFKDNKKTIKRTSKKLYFYNDRPGCTYVFRRKIVETFNNVWKPEYPHDDVLFKIAFLSGGLYNYNYYGIKWRRHSSSATIKNWKSVSSEAVILHYNDIKLYIDYYMQFEKIWVNKKEIFKVQRWLDLRKKLYETKSFIVFIKLLRYFKYYRSYKTYISEFLALTKYNVIKTK